MFRDSILVLIVSAGLLTLSSAARAQLIVGDGFNYAPGAINNDGGGTGWPTDNQHNWFTTSGTTTNQVTAGGLSFSNGGKALATSGNKLTTAGSDTGAFRNPPTDFGNYGGDNNQTLWISFLAANTINSNQGGYGGLSLMNAFTNNGTYTQQENFFVGQTSASGQYGFVNYSPSNSNPSTFLTGMGTDTTTHLITVELEFMASGTTTISMYMDPTPGLAPTTPQATQTYTGSFVFNQFRFQSGSDSSASYNFDELRMGSSYTDVAPVATPEPSGFATAGLGCLALFLTAGHKRRWRV